MAVIKTIGKILLGAATLAAGLISLYLIGLTVLLIAGEPAPDELQGMIVGFVTCLFVLMLWTIGQAVWERIE